MAPSDSGHELSPSTRAETSAAGPGSGDSGSADPAARLQRLQLALWASGDRVWEWHGADDRVRIQRFVDAGSDVEETLGTRADLLALVHAGDREQVELAWRMHARGDTEVLEITFRHADEHSGRWMRLRGRAVERDAEGQPQRFIGTLKDITEQRRSEESLQLLGHAFASNRDGLLIVDLQGRVVDSNQALADMLACPVEDLRELNLRDFIDAPAAALDELWHSGRLECEADLRLRNGSSLPVDLVGSHFNGGGRRRDLFVLSLRDISDRRRSSERMQRMALYDALTGLPNRSRFEQVLAEHLPAHEEVAPFALLLLNLDGFKAINDGLGHAAGDELLREIALRLRGWVGANDFVARWSGDEFYVIAKAADPRHRGEKLAARLHEVVSEPVDLGEHRLAMTPSIGIVLAPEHAASPAALIKLANIAMHAAKRNGRARCEFYRSELDGDSLRELQVLGALREDLDRHRLKVVAQPKVNLDGRIVGYETLMRWHHDDLGAMPPSYFIPLAERNGLISRIGLIAIEQSVQFAARLAARGYGTEVALNLSPHQLNEAHTLPRLIAACKQHRVSPRQIGIEITESALIEHPEAARQAILAIKDLGFSVALDDFGTGYSSLAYLRELPLDKVKIDRSFVQDIERDPRAGLLLGGVVSLCHMLGMRVVAEGVETEAQKAFLREHGVDEMQGYLFRRPTAVEVLLTELGDG